MCIRDRHDGGGLARYGHAGVGLHVDYGETRCVGSVGRLEDPGRVDQAGVDLGLPDAGHAECLQPGAGAGAAAARVDHDHEIGGHEPALFLRRVDADAGDPDRRPLQAPYAALLEGGHAVQGGHPGPDDRVEEVAAARDVELHLPEARDPALGGLGDQVGGQAAADRARRRPVLGDAGQDVLDRARPAGPHDVDVPGLGQAAARRRAVREGVGVDDRDRRVLGQDGGREQAGHAAADDDGVTGRGRLGHRVVLSVRAVLRASAQGGAAAGEEMVTGVTLNAPSRARS